MDYLDPRKRRRHTIILYVGYMLIGIGIIIAATLLVYQAYGFGVDKKGEVIQNGLVFVSTQPAGANIYIDGDLKKPKTNTRLKLPAATYQILLQREGYQSWTRSVDVMGGKVKRFDYPMLIPKQLETTQLAEYPSPPTLGTQSPSKRWLVVSQPTAFGTFDVYDLRDPTKAPTPLTLPAELLTAPATGVQSWEFIEWADDNDHFLLKHRYDDKFEYILMSRENPVQSVNITRSLEINPTKLTLIDRKFDRYYAYDAEAKSLTRASLKTTELTPVLSDVLNYQSYGDDTLLYATATGAEEGQVKVILKAGDKQYNIRSLTASPTYLLDITKYDDRFYVVAGAVSENKVYVYRDPAGQIGNNAFKSPVPIHVLRVNQPNFVSFSSSAQFVMIQNGLEFAVYDIEYDEGFRYTAKQTLDPPQTNATWMDGNRLTYISGGKHIMFDYDNRNPRTLSAASANYRPFFAPDFRFSYTLSTDPSGVTVLNQTALRTPTDL